MFEKWKAKVKTLKKDTLVLYEASLDNRISRWQKILAMIVIGYLFCPLDLIPDFIPVLGYLDDFIIVPVGILILTKTIPSEVIEDARKRVNQQENIPVGKKTAIVVIILWIIGILSFFWFFIQILNS